MNHHKYVKPPWGLLPGYDELCHIHDEMSLFWKMTIPKIMKDLDKLEEKRRSEEWDPKKFEENMKRREKKREEKRTEEMKEEVGEDGVLVG